MPRPLIIELRLRINHLFNREPNVWLSVSFSCSSVLIYPCAFWCSGVFCDAHFFRLLSPIFSRFELKWFCDHIFKPSALQRSWYVSCIYCFLCCTKPNRFILSCGTKLLCIISHHRRGVPCNTCFQPRLFNPQSHDGHHIFFPQTWSLTFWTLWSTL